MDANLKKYLATYCELEKKLKFKLCDARREVERREKELKDFKDFTFNAWLYEDYENNYELLVHNAYHVQEGCKILLPFERDHNYQARVNELEKNISEAKAALVPLSDEYETFVRSPFGSIAEKTNRNFFNRSKRLEKRINFMFDLKRRVFFLTFTFNDNALARYSEKALKKAVLDYVRKNCEYYVVNKDFGAENARLHFHAVVVAKNDKVDTQVWNEKYGFMFYRVCGKKRRDKQNIKLYVTKLARHTVKDTTAQDERLIYSRAFALVGI